MNTSTQGFRPKTNSTSSEPKKTVYTRQAIILRKNLGEWDAVLRNPRGEDWPRMLGRLNAAYNQTVTMDKSIEDLMEHFVYLPKQSTANAQDIPFFLSTRLEAGTADASSTNNKKQKKNDDDAASSIQNENDDNGPIVQGDPVKILSAYEARAAALAQEYEDDMDRF